MSQPEGPLHRPNRSRRSTVAALVLASVALAVVDLSSPALEPVRRGVGEIVGPLQTGADVLARPITSIPEFFDSRDQLRAEITRLETEKAELAQRVQSSGVDRRRLASYDGLMSSAMAVGFAIVPARVVGFGAGQSFEHTITIDAGSAAGIAADMTVVAAEGLVGRVLRVTRQNATVLLIADDDSVVGGRVDSSSEVGFVRGSGALGAQAELDYELLDPSTPLVAGESVVTWGSSKGAPYISGVPIGTVESVYSSVRDSTQRARIKPYVTFSQLDVVGVAVPSGTESDRGVIDVDGVVK